MKSVKCQSCGFVSLSTDNCKKCGAPITVVKHKFQPMNPMNESSKAWRDHDKLVMALEAVLPDRCIVCNASADGRRFPLTISYNHKLSKAALLVGVASVSYKEVKLPVGLCATHVSGQQLNVFLGIGVMIAGLVVAFAAIFSFTSAKTVSGPIIVMMLGFIVSMLGAVLMSHNPLEIEDANDACFWIKGASPEFLANLPQWTSKLP